MFGRQKVAMLVAEFLGAATLTSAVYAMAVRTSFPYFAAGAAGMTVGLMVLVVGATSGAHLNPAVTVGLWTLRKIQTMQALVYIAAQMLGGVAAWRLMEYLMDSPLKDIAGKNVDWRIMVAEAVGTLIFGFAIAAATIKGYEGLQLAVTVGTGLFIGAMVAAFASNGLLNPAVALGVQSFSVSYVVAPIVGSIVGMNLYSMLFAPAPVKRKVVTKKKK